MPKSEERQGLPSRREMLAGVVGTAAVGTGALAGAQQTEAPKPRPRAPEDPTKMQGLVPRPLGERSAFETPRRLVRVLEPSSSSRTPLQYLQGIVTPADLHFERHHAGIPNIDPERYELLIHGMVDRPTTFSLADLKRFPAESHLRFLECSGNGGTAFQNQGRRPDMSPQEMDGLTSTSEWTGVPLKLLFREVGARPEATWFLAEAMDAAVMTRSVPMEKAWDDAIVAYAQNGEPLRPEQGYPARLFLPGWEGNASVKWLRRLELSDRPFMTREETSKYTDPLPGEKARMFSFTMDAKSLLTFPTYPGPAGRARLVGNPGYRLDRSRQDHPGGDFDRRWRHLGGRRTPGAGAPQVPRPFPQALELGRPPRHPDEPGDRRERVRPADPGSAAPGPRVLHALPLQPDPSLARGVRRAGLLCRLTIRGGSARRCHDADTSTASGAT